MLWFLNHRKKMKEKWAQTVGVSKQICVCVCSLAREKMLMDCSENCILRTKKSLSVFVYARSDNSALIDEWMSQFTHHDNYCCSSSSSARATIFRISNLCTMVASRTRHMISILETTQPMTMMMNRLLHQDMYTNMDESSGISAHLIAYQKKCSNHEFTFFFSASLLMRKEMSKKICAQ